MLVSRVERIRFVRAVVEINYVQVFDNRARAQRSVYAMTIFDMVVKAILNKILI